MNNYESVIIIKPKAIQELQKIQNSIEKIVNVKEYEEIKIKDFPYTVKNYNKGFYIPFSFKCNPEKIEILQKYYKENENILKFIIYKVEV